MTNDNDSFYALVENLAHSIEQNDKPDPRLYDLFIEYPDFVFKILDLLANLDETELDQEPPIYAACVFGLDLGVAQLQTAKENQSKGAAKMLDRLMDEMASHIRSKKHSLSFWLPVLNSFYESHTELSESLKEAYFSLASDESEHVDDEPEAHLRSIRDLINELSDLSVFDIAEHFFAQSYAMPPEFFIDLLLDLLSIEEGKDIAILTLLHPKPEVRDVAMDTLDQTLDQLVISSASLSRLNAIMQWYPESYKPMFSRWIKHQRKKGVTFLQGPEAVPVEIKATEIDGSGAQGVFIHSSIQRKHRLCGMLFKYNIGVKESWVTSDITSAEVKEYYSRAFDDSVTLRRVDEEYLDLLAEHFLAVTLEQNDIPNVYFLEIQELMGKHYKPCKINNADLIDELSVQILPFTQDSIDESLQRSKQWLKSKQFTESWYIESPLIDKIVNHHCSFVDGVKVCRFDEAVVDVFKEDMEPNRERWVFHFLWLTLWFKAREKRNEKLWKDSFIIAHQIHNGIPLTDIPVMREICLQTVVNSVETMQDRRTYLSKE